MSGNVNHFAAAQSLCDELGLELAVLSATAFNSAAECLIATHSRNGTIYILGNGGSAATGSHFASDLAKATRLSGVAAVRAVALTDNTSLFSAWANDTDYESVFERQLDGLLEPRDALVAFSVSGTSVNILRGLSVARAAGARSIGLLGNGGGKAGAMVDVAVVVDSAEFAVVESAHLAIAHALVNAVRSALELRPRP